MYRTVLMMMFLSASQAAALAQTPPLEELKKEALTIVESNSRLTQQIVDSIFSFAELGYQEFETSAYLTGLLEKNGFQVTRGVAGMPTAFVASWGSGKPVIGFMADIDGLPETSQKPGVAYQAPLVPNGPGHGEGHNSHQAVNVTAAIAVKRIMEKYKLPGTLRLYPGVAEELLGSRTYMVLAGLFRDLDVMLSNHVSSGLSTAYGLTGTGVVSTMFTFEGRTAHAAAAPWAGRSALDAVELMNTGWNFRREHLRLESRSHYVITKGGDQPNVVPPMATVWYYFRDLDYERIKEVHEIGQRVAQGAALMTDTTVTERVLAATWPAHYNKPLAEAVYANIKQVGLPGWSEADERMARAAQAELKVAVRGLQKEIPELKPPPAARGGGGSDDVAEVSWNVPTCTLSFPANIPGMIFHHWSSGIAMATPIAHKGANTGAKVQALTALDVLLNPALLAAAKQYFAEQTRETTWKSLIPEGATPPVELNREKMERVRPELRKLRYDPTKYKTYLEQLGIEYPTIRQ